MTSTPDPLNAVTTAARRMEQRPDLAGTLDEIVVQARACLPEFEHVGLSLAHRDGTVETLAATDEKVKVFDDLQSTTGQGPRIDALLENEVVVVSRARHEQRWPAYIRAAVRAGLRSQIGIRLPVADDATTGLNLYSTTNDEVDPGAVGVAEHFAVVAGLALGRARLEDQLRTAIGTRTTIGTAVGILMERHGMSRAAAFEYLVRQSTTSNTKVRRLAVQVVEETEQRHQNHS